MFKPSKSHIFKSIILFLCLLSSPLRANEPESEAIYLDGLKDSVEIKIDTWGVPHIYAKNQNDVFFSQGFNVARERLWQIDLWRRQGLGKLSEILGSQYIEKDRAQRLFLYRGNLQKEWKANGRKTQKAVSAFVAGINAYVHYINNNPTQLPIEFQIIGYQPELWSVDDVVKIRAHSPAQNLESELTRAITVRDVGIEVDKLRKALQPSWETQVPKGLDLSVIPDDALSIYNLAKSNFISAPLFNSLPSVAEQNNNVENPQLSDAKKRFISKLNSVLLPHIRPLQTLEGSNSWAISPELTATGRPILASDPHRLNTLPSLRYITHLNAPGLNVIGAGEPILPGISVGHNGHVAFGFTIYSMDQEDLYVYQTDPDDPNRYRYLNTWKDMDIINEDISVLGSDTYIAQLKFTRHGPVIYEDPINNIALAARVAWLEPGMTPYLGAVQYMYAKSWRDFKRKINRYWGGPAENHIFADKRGNIAWKPAGKLPIRGNWDGLYPVPGDGRYEWLGFWPNQVLPSSINPQNGWLASANQQNIPEDYPYSIIRIGFEWPDASRYQWIESVLSSGKEFTIDDSLALQTDYTSIPAQRIKALLVNLSSADPETALILQSLVEWDGKLTPDSRSAAIFEIWYNLFLRKAVMQNLVGDAALIYLANGVSWGDQETILSILENPGPTLGDQQAREQLLTQSLQEAILFMNERNILGVQWGQLHTMKFTHPLSAVVDENTQSILNTASFPRGGSADTVNANWHVSQLTNDFRTVGGATWRMVIDVGEWDNSRAMNSPGQSGNVFSDEYKNLSELWAQQESFPLLYSDEAIDAATQRVIALKPAPQKVSE
ncbi:penicillin acylase family protein [Paraglaciecola sp.]|uniref:penicillin acylase family protein n=1 Tax=Paraglaciecola sp. TaxID=1920173 RepID=UPI0030F3D2A0